MNSGEFIHWCAASSLERAQSKPLIMGVLNVTPDSFSDGGRYASFSDAQRQIEVLISEGADLIDVGGESSRPGALSISEEEEQDRTLPIIEYIRASSGIAISIDTIKPAVMESAVAAGATLINDVNALQAPNALAIASRLNVPVCLMHMQGIPRTMQSAPTYPLGVIPTIKNFFSERIHACLEVGILRQHIILDPGFGFGKTNHHNLLLTRFFSEFKSFNLPVMYGVSRKSTIGSLLNRPVDNRLFGGLAFVVSAVLGGANIIRTHDVAATKDAVNVAYLIEKSAEKGEIG